MTGTTLALRIRSFRNRDRDRRGQALVEFALVLPLLVLILMGVMQFGLLFWSQITLTQVARDTGRWVSSQPTCVGVNVAGQANAIAAKSTLFGWGPGRQITLSAGPTYTNNTPPPYNNPSVVCPPADNREVWDVSFELAHTVPTFLPLLGPTWTLHAEVQYRMEPGPQ